MTNLGLNTDGDLDFSTGGLVLVDGVDELVQKLIVRLQFFLGEWFLDQRLGIPYYQAILVKSPNLVSVQSIFREVILETPGVDELLGAIVLSLDGALRRLSVSFTVRATTGEAVDFDREFIIGD